MPSSNRGFTLLEIIVAIVIGATILLGARAALDQLGDAAERITAAATTADRVANTERLVRGLFRRMVASESEESFAASPMSSRFVSWCDRPAGWRERCTVTVRLLPVTPPATAAILYTSAGDTIRLVDGAGRITMRYLDEPAHEGRWVGVWTPAAGTPLAVRIATDRDTLVFVIGERQ